jgi:hypothetical protein
MKYIRLFVALLAACIFVVPAFSMQDNGNAMKDCPQQIDVPCPKHVMGEMAQGPQKCDCQNSMENQVGQNFAPRPMMDGKQQNQFCKNSNMGQDRNNGPHSMMDGKQQNQFCKNSNMGQDRNNGPRSMMDGKQQNQFCKDSNMDQDRNYGHRPMMDNTDPK